MSDEASRRRRRRPDAAPAQEPAPRIPAEQAPKAPAEPIRIVVGQTDDQPDWMVSAGSTAGAASRRTKKSDSAPRRTQESARFDPQQAFRPSPVRMQDAQPAPGQEPERKQTHAEMPADEMQPVRKAARPEGAQRSAPPAKKKSIKRKKKARAALLRRIRTGVILAAAAALLIAGTIFGVNKIGYVMDVKAALDMGDGVFYPNMYVNGIPLEGKTLDEAAVAVTSQVNSLMSSWKITLVTEDGRSWDITSEDLNMQYDIADQLDQLWAIGHTGSSEARYEQVKPLLEGESIHRHTTLRYDMTLVNQILSHIKSDVDKSPVNATKIYDETKWPPYSYTDDIPGKELDISGIGEQICSMVDELASGTVYLTAVDKPAAVTRDFLEGQIVQLAMYETGIGKTGDYVENRHENIRIGTEKFNHLTIMPGESVSFNKVTGLRNANNGYQVALELAYGEYREGVGGGICQVSSTLYNAVMCVGGLTVTQRTAHSHPSSYVPKGQDATVQDNRLDFVFRNDTNADIFIETNYYKKKNYYYTQFIIYGKPDPNGYTYALESVVAETLPIPPVRYVPDKEQKYVVYDDESHVVSEGEEGYVVDVYRVTKDERGLEVSREKIHTDTYKAIEPVTYVGVLPRETPVPDGYGLFD